MLRTTTLALLMAALTTAFITANSSPAAACDDEEAYGPTLNRALVARHVENRVPADTEGPFEANGERLYVFLEVDNPGDAEVVYTVNWYHRDLDHHFAQTIEAGHSPRWRTWVYHRMSERRAGDWHVEVVAPSGEVQAELDFSVVPASPEPPSVAEPPAATTPSI